MLPAELMRVLINFLHLKEGKNTMKNNHIDVPKPVCLYLIILAAVFVISIPGGCTRKNDTISEKNPINIETDISDALDAINDKDEPDLKNKSGEMDIIDAINSAKSIDELFDLFEMYKSKIDGAYAEAYGYNLLKMYKGIKPDEFIKKLSKREHAYIPLIAELLIGEAYLEGGEKAVNELETDMEDIQKNMNLPSEANTASVVWVKAEEIKNRNRFSYIADDNDFTVWKGSKKITLKDLEKDIDLEDILGKPTSEKKEELGPGADTYTGSFIKNLKYNGIELWLFMPKGGENSFWIYSIEVTSPEFSVGRGISVGNSKDDLKTIYRGIQIAADGRGDENNCAYEIREVNMLSYVSFEVKESKVAKIKIHHDFP